MAYSRKKYEILAIMADILQNTQTLTLLFCRGRLRNERRFIMHLHNHCVVLSFISLLLLNRNMVGIYLLIGVNSAHSAALTDYDLFSV